MLPTIRFGSLVLGLFLSLLSTFASADWTFVECVRWSPGWETTPLKSAIDQANSEIGAACYTGMNCTAPYPMPVTYNCSATLTNLPGCFQGTPPIISYQSGADSPTNAGAGTLTKPDAAGNYHCVVDSSAWNGPKANGPCPSCAGNPVNVATGNKFQREDDIRSTGDGSLEFYRYYNSYAPQWFFGIGYGWTHTWSRKLGIAAPGQVNAYRPDGKLYSFNQTGSTWTPDADVVERLATAGSGWTLTTADDEIETYDANGHLTSLTSKSGKVTTLTYSDGTTGANGGVVVGGTQALPAGLLIRVTDFQGRTLQFGYSASNNLVSLTDAAGNAFGYTYDSSNNLTSVKYPGTTNPTRTYVYNEPANTDISQAMLLTGIVDELSVRFATFQYASSGRAKATFHAGNVDNYSIGFDANGLNVTVTDPLGTARVSESINYMGVSVLGRTTQQPGTPCVGCSQTTMGRFYDSQHNLTDLYDYNGNLSCYTYDTVRNLETARVEGLSGTGSCASKVTTSATRTITTSWRAGSRQIAQRSEPLRIATYSYNGDPGVTCTPTGGSHNLVCSKTVQATTDATGSSGLTPVATSDPAMTWTYTYNVNGQILTMDGPRTDVADVMTYAYYTTNDPSGNYRIGDLASITNALGQVTQFTQYDGNGHLLTSVDPNGLQTIRTYDVRSRLTSQKIGTAVVGYELTQYDYDDSSNLKKVTLPDTSFVAYSYDDAHRLTQMQDGLGNTVVYTLDAMGNRTAETANDVHGALARRHTRVVDALNRIAQDIGGTNPVAQVTVNTYDANNNLLTTTDPLTHQTTQTYDARNRVIQIQDPLNGSAAPTVYGYNGLDQIVSVTDPKSHATTYALNGYGEVLTLTSPDTGVTTYTYNAASNLTKKIDARGDPAGKALYTYDALNRTTTITYVDETITYTYDSCTNGVGRLCNIADKSGSTAYTYDVKGRVASKAETITLAVGSSKTLTVTYSYNTAGQLTGIHSAGGRQIGYSYTNNRPTGVQVNSGAVLTGATYEPFGPNSGWTWGNGDQHFRVPDLDFRPSVVQSETASSTPYFSRTYSYDGANNILGITDGVTASLNSTQTYDSLNRLGSFTQNSVARNYTYDGVGNRLTDNQETYTYLPGSNRLNSATGAQAFNYSYDLVGNQLSNGQGAWIFGGNNRAQTAQSTATGQSATFLVNALGQRVMKSNGSGVKTLFVYDEAGHLIGEYDSSGTPLTEHVWLGDLPVAVLK